MLTEAFFHRHPLPVAKELIGMEFTWDGASGIIVETEAYYEHGDEACHLFFRPSVRAFVEASAPGTAYVYLNYGVHWLINMVVRDAEGSGLVLLRALKPTNGLPEMQQRRKREKLRDLCSGPGKLTQALGIHGDHHGVSLTTHPQRGFRETGQTPDVIVDERIGITQSPDLPWRFTAAGSDFVSRKAKVDRSIR